jgi:hypothetical protein
MMALIPELGQLSSLIRDGRAVSDSSLQGPVRCDTPTDSEQGLGLQVVEALSAHWGWPRQDGGKAVFAVFLQEV